MKNMEIFWPQRIIPVALMNNADNAIPLARALMDAGLNVVEITLRTDAAMESLRRIREEFPDMILGAGTVLNRRQVHELQELDVNYIMTPGMSEDVVGAAKERDLPILPGVMTITEIERARTLGLKYLKFFPAEASGGARLLYAMTRPYVQTGLRFIPTGDITLESMPGYFDVDCVAAVGGSWFVSPELIDSGKFAEITKLAKEAIEVAAKYAKPLPPLPKNAKEDLL
ncbi:MAG: bifunctional 4-hydroxy-2-oxoglutarate aldolase/2-dehydro-3-deoxy-phosphogluconate aldolase [Opitutales bacterium]|nr:bifunctional 4-hydroxy-2-oxoglutarate aldolase/2-dehydro-3-deoxy-phosphogluconate aldolase [Opitutales bacterium]